MAKDPDQRYPDATTFAAVRAAAADQPLPDVPATGNLAAAPAGARPRRRRLLIIAATTLMIVTVGLSVWRPWLTELTTVEKTVCARDTTVRNTARSKAIIATLRRDDRIQVHTQKADHGWAQIDLPDGRHGWVLAEYLGPPC